RGECGLQPERGGKIFHSGEKKLKRKIAGLVLAVAAVVGSSCSHPDRIVIGSKNFTEQVILGELLAQEIERTTPLQVDRRLNLGGTFICHQAIVAGQIDAYVEYTGTALTAILKKPVSTDAKQVYDTVRNSYRDQF